MAEAKTNTATEKVVKVKLPRNKGQNANQDEFFSVNFKNYMIKRGEIVEIPEKLAKVIEDNEQAEEYALDFLNEKRAKEQ